MTAETVFSFLSIWGLIGIAVFTVLVLIYSQTGMFTEAREEDGRLKKKVSFKGILSTLIILFGTIGLQLIGNAVTLRQSGLSYSFLRLFLLNYALYWVLFLYDTFVIDILVIVKWHPKFMKLPDTKMFTSAK